MKPLYKFLIALALFGLSAGATTAVAQTYNIGSPTATDVKAVISGSGSNLTLTISGTGKMQNFTYSSSTSNTIPWYSIRANIKTLVINEGVTTIGNYAFAYCSGFTGSLTIPNSVTTIGNSAFEYCSGFTGSLTIGNSVTTIEHGAFYSCSGFTGSLTIGNSVTTIGYNAFSGCSKLTSITIGNSVTTIENGTFSGCSGLTIVNYNAINCTIMDSNCFQSCTNFKTLNIGEDVTKIPDYAFQNCSSLTGTLTIPNSVTSIGNSAFYNCGFTGILTIPNSITSIGTSAFYGCSGFTTLNYNATNCTTMGSSSAPVFQNCTGLTTLNIGSNVTKIPDYAFQNCSSLTGTLTIPNSVTSIGNYAFSGCKNIKPLTIPSSVTSIGNYAFQSCTKLDTVTVQWATPLSVSNVFPGVTCSNVTLKVPTGTASLYRGANVWKEFKIPIEQSELACATPTAYGAINPIVWSLCDSTLTISGSGAMSNNYFVEGESYCPWYEHRNSIKNLIIDDKITSIADYAFYDLTKLVSVTIPENITAIGNKAFYGCTGLTTLNFNATNCTTVGSSGNLVFGNCTNLTTVNIGNNVTRIPAYAFSGCNKITSINNPNSVTTIGEYAFNGCSGIVGVLTIHQNITSIGDRAFYGCSGITTVNFNATNCTTMGSSGNAVFGSCSNFKTLNIGNNVTRIPAYAFLDCSKITSLVIPSSVTNIGNYAFNSCSGIVGVLTIHQNVTTIGDRAFYGCTSLTAVNFNATNCTTMGSSGNAVFGGCSNFKTLNIGNNVTKIPAYAFLSCSNLLFVTIPNSVTNIGSYAFSGCSKLADIVFPNNLTTINDYTFQNCTSIKVLVIPDNITTISNTAFSGCTNIEELTIPQIFSAFLTITGNLKKLTVGKECTSIPASSFSTCTNLVELSIPFVGTTPFAPNSLVSLFGSSVPTTLKKFTLIRSDNNIQIANSAFSGLVQLTSVTLSSNVRGVGENAFNGCGGLEHLYSEWAYPPTAYANSTFNGVNKFSCVLHVPVGSKDKYSSPQALGWNEWWLENIQEEAAVTIVARPLPLYGGVISGALQYNYDDNASITANGNMGYSFQGWLEGQTIVSISATYNFMVTAPRTLYAVFTPHENENTVTVQAQPNSAVIEWDGEVGASTYTLIIYTDAAHTDIYATIHFNANGTPMSAPPHRATQSRMSYTLNELQAEQKYYYSITSYDSEDYALSMAVGSFETVVSGIEEVAVNKLVFYPNPVKNELIIKNEELRMGDYSIFNVSGQVLMQGQLLDETTTINVKELPNGMYFVKVGGKTGKFIKE